MKGKLLRIFCPVAGAAFLACLTLLLVAFSQLQPSFEQMDPLTKTFWVAYILLQAPMFWGGLVSLILFAVSLVWLLRIRKQ